jgi:aminoglycoside 6'-N-acetyltransferase I
MRIEPASAAHLDAWAELRFALWPWDTVAERLAEARALYCAGDPGRAAYLALDAQDRVIGFAEAALRQDYVEGCATSPVAFLEGIYVAPEVRRAGIARRLADKVAAWGRSLGCTEFASNALLDNLASHRFHRAIGFAETERVVYFRKDL